MVHFKSSLNTILFKFFMGLVNILLLTNNVLNLFFFQQKVIDSENKRRYDRLLNHLSNDVWTKRESPPEDFNSEIPGWKEKHEVKNNLYFFYQIIE